MITVLASSSSGNCYHLSSQTPILLDCGITFKKIKEAIDIKEVKACLITHEHQDHIKALKQLLKSNITCYMSEGTKEAVGFDNDLIKIIEPLKQFSIKEWQILPFNTEHDAKEPLGFLLKNDTSKTLYLTDSYYCRYNFKGLTHILIECNYSLSIINKNVEDGLIHEARRRRALTSHFELENVKQFLKACDLSKVAEIYLIHISKDNGDKDLFKSEIEAITGKAVIV